MWYNGPAQYVKGFDSARNNVDIAGINVGYWGENSLSIPKVGQVYTAHIVGGVFNTWRVAFGVRLGVLLPQGTSFYFAPSQPLFICRRQALGAPSAVDVTTSPGASCPSAAPIRLQNTFYDLGLRDVPANSYFEIVFELVTSVPLTGAQLRGYILCTDGETYCDVPVYVYGHPSGQLEVLTDPPGMLYEGVRYTFSVVTRDSGSHALVAGTATVYNFEASIVVGPGIRISGIPVVLQFPTNMPQLVTFYYRYSTNPDGSTNIVVPSGVVNCPGYPQQNIPFKFA
jgi:hypothetical protein